MNRSLAVVAVGLMVLGTGACAGPVHVEGVPAGATVSEGEVQALRERAAVYWAARMTEDDKTQWELLEPRGRGRMTPKEYASERQGVRYLGYQVEDAVIDGYFAVVKVRLLIQPLLPRLVSIAPQPVLLDDQWIRIGGSWYRQVDGQQPRSGQR